MLLVLGMTMCTISKKITAFLFLTKLWRTLISQKKSSCHDSSSVCNYEDLSWPSAVLVFTSFISENTRSYSAVLMGKSKSNIIGDGGAGRASAGGREHVGRDVCIVIGRE